MRYYAIRTINGLTTFNCPRCKHSVTLLEFNSQNGNRRTQAARAMNDHATAVHSRPMPASTRDVEIWHAR